MKQLSKNIFQTACLICLVAIGGAVGARAATYTVNLTTDPGDGTCDATCTLRDAIIAAFGSGEASQINFDPAVFGTTPQTIQTDSREFQLPFSNALTINGPGANLLTISGRNTYRVINSSNIGSKTIIGVTISNGNGAGNGTGFGGGITNSGNLTLMNVVVTNNTVATDSSTIRRGAGIYNTGTLNLMNTTVSGNNLNYNSAINYGGGIYNTSSGTVTLTNSTVSGNTLTSDGSTNHGCGILNLGGTINVNGSTISNNTANGASVNRGCGIFNSLSTGTINITNSTISGNSASNANSQNVGGAIYTEDGSKVNILNSTVSGNNIYTTVSTNYGGGIAMFGSTTQVTTVNIINSTFSGNTTTGKNNLGGGIFNSGGVIKLRNATFTLNTATGGNLNLGGGIYNDDSVGGTMTDSGNTIIAGNTATAGGADFFGTLTSQGYNLIGDTQDTNITGDTTGNILNQNPNLGVLQNNGGPTQTHALLMGSPAREAGSNALAVDQNNNPLTTDQRGAGFPRINGTNVDIGAFESLAPTAAGVSISGRVTNGRRGVSGAIVYLTDQSGATKAARTNPFGYYRFDDILPGHTVIIDVVSKRYQFTPQVVNVVDSLSSLDFTAQDLMSGNPMTVKSRNKIKKTEGMFCSHKIICRGKD